MGNIERERWNDGTIKMNVVWDKNAAERLMSLGITPSEKTHCGGRRPGGPFHSCGGRIDPGICA